MSTAETGHNEFEKDSPFLEATGNRTPFEVPERYFEQQNELLCFELLNRSAIMGNSQPWSVPGGYFESSAKQIQNRIGKVKSFVSNAKKWYLIAAVLLVTVCISLLWFKNPSTISDRLTRLKNDSLAKSNLVHQPKKVAAEHLEMEEYILSHYSAEELAYNK